MSPACRRWQTLIAAKILPSSDRPKSRSEGAEPRLIYCMFAEDIRSFRDSDARYASDIKSI